MPFSLKDKVRSFCSKHSLLCEEKILVAVSGGVDSMVLLHLLLGLLGEKRVVAMHINHLLRGEESLRDQTFLEEICKEWRVELRVEEYPVAEIAEERGFGTEEAARFVRREALMRAAERLRIPHIATGHNLNDHVETMIVKMIQGTGLRGIMGILPIQPPFVRPLINTTREEILKYAESEGVPFVEDSTNRDTKYLRNWVRHRVIPLLQERNPSFLKVAKRLSEVAREHIELSEELADEAWKKLSRWEGETPLLEVKGFNSLHPTLQRLVVIRFLNAAFPEKRIGRSHVLQVCRLATAPPGKVLGVPGGCVERGEEYLVPHPVTVRELSRVEESPYEPETCSIEGRGIYHWGGYTWRVYTEIWPLKLDFAKGVALSLQKISMPLLLRCRRHGDRIYRSGVGHKEVKKIMQEKGIPKEKREAIPLLVDPSENRVLWVAGLGADPRATPQEGETALIVEREE